MQGFNMGRYVPPEVEGTVSGNRLHGKHPLGSRARTPGALTVRFEMPFAVWCTTCHPQGTVLIGQGVRFNAAKRRVGSYHSTPVWSFEMRHPPCGGAIEVRTDPRNAEYVVVSGGTRRGNDGRLREDEGESLLHKADLVRARLVGSFLGRGKGGGEGGRNDNDAREAAFASLEKTIADRAALAASASRVEELADVAAKAWEDPYARNRELRRSFRVGRKERERVAGEGEAIGDKMSLADDVVVGAETDEDRRRAAVVDFGGLGDDLDHAPVGGGADAAMRAMARPLFGGASPGPLGTKRGHGFGPGNNNSSNSSKKKKKKTELKADLLKAKTMKGLADEIGRNIRMAKDPFLEKWNTESPRGPVRLPGLKRKRESGMDAAAEIAPPAERREMARSDQPAKTSVKAASLVEYDSD